MFDFLKRKSKIIEVNNINSNINSNINRDNKSLSDWLKDNINLASDVYIYVKEHDAFKYICRCIPSNLTLDNYLTYKNNIIESIYPIMTRLKNVEYVIYLSDELDNKPSKCSKCNKYDTVNLILIK